MACNNYLFVCSRRSLAPVTRMQPPTALLTQYTPRLSLSLQIDGEPQNGFVNRTRPDMYAWSWLPGYGSVEITLNAFVGTPYINGMLNSLASNTAYDFFLDGWETQSVLVVSTQDSFFKSKCPDALLPCPISLYVSCYGVRAPLSADVPVECGCAR